ncbi:hypothetical protein ACHWQZ_G010411 [Mnemiopsis leidyi]
MKTWAFQSCPLVILLQLVADIENLSPHLAWLRICLLLAGDVESNPGPTNFQSVYCSSSSPEQFPFTDKNVLVLGDSMVKHVGSREQNDSTRLYPDSYRHLRVLSYRGMGTQQVADEVLNINTSRLPIIDAVYILVGTNNIKEFPDCVDNLWNCESFTKTLDSPVSAAPTTNLSGIVTASPPTIPLSSSSHPASPCNDWLLRNLQYYTDVLSPILLHNTQKMLLSYVKHNYFIEQGQSTSEVLLFGSEKYIYNRATKSLKPIPIEREPLLLSILANVNNRLSTKFNSVLVNFYKDSNTILPYHKDDEKKLDKSVPIATLSIGATRYMEFSTSKTSPPSHRQQLRSNSLFVMSPATQASHFHRIAPGAPLPRKSEYRFSLTFRKLTSYCFPAATPPSSDPALYPPTPAAPPSDSSPATAATAPTPTSASASAPAPIAPATALAPDSPAAPSPASAAPPPATASAPSPAAAPPATASAPAHASPAAPPHVTASAPAPACPAAPPHVTASAQAHASPAAPPHVTASAPAPACPAAPPHVTASAPSPATASAQGPASPATASAPAHASPAARTAPFAPSAHPATASAPSPAAAPPASASAPAPDSPAAPPPASASAQAPASPAAPPHVTASAPSPAAATPATASAPAPASPAVPPPVTAFASRAPPSPASASAPASPAAPPPASASAPAPDSPAAPPHITASAPSPAAAPPAIASAPAPASPAAPTPATASATAPASRAAPSLLLLQLQLLLLLLLGLLLPLLLPLLHLLP